MLMLDKATCLAPKNGATTTPPIQEKKEQKKISKLFHVIDRMLETSKSQETREFVATKIHGLFSQHPEVAKAYRSQQKMPQDSPRLLCLGLLDTGDRNKVRALIASIPFEDRPTFIQNCQSFISASLPGKERLLRMRAFRLLDAEHRSIIAKQMNQLFRDLIYDQQIKLVKAIEAYELPIRGIVLSKILADRSLNDRRGIRLPILELLSQLPTQEKNRDKIQGHADQLLNYLKSNATSSWRNEASSAFNIIEKLKQRPPHELAKALQNLNAAPQQESPVSQINCTK